MQAGDYNGGSGSEVLGALDTQKPRVIKVSILADLCNPSSGATGDRKIPGACMLASLVYLAFYIK